MYEIKKENVLYLELLHWLIWLFERTWTHGALRSCYLIESSFSSLIFYF